MYPLTPFTSRLVVAARSSSATCTFWIGSWAGFGVISVIWVVACAGEKFCAVTVQVLDAFTAIDEGAHACVSVTSPWREKNATGMKMSLAPAALGSSLIDPKYCVFGASPSPVIVNVSVFVWPGSIPNFDWFTEIDAPAGAEVVAVSCWDAPLTFVNVRAVVMLPPNVGALMLGRFASIRWIGSAPRAA